MILGKGDIIDSLKNQLDTSTKDLFLGSSGLVTRANINDILKHIPEYTEDEFTESEINRVIGESNIALEFHDNIDSHLKTITDRRHEKNMNSMSTDHKDSHDRLQRKQHSLQVNRGVEHDEKINHMMIDREDKIRELKEKLSSTSDPKVKSQIRSHIESLEEENAHLREAEKHALTHMTSHYGAIESSIEHMIEASEQFVTEALAKNSKRIEESFSSIEEAIEHMDRMALEADATSKEGLEAEEARIKKYAETAKGKKKKSYEKKIEELDKKIEESSDDIDMDDMDSITDIDDDTFDINDMDIDLDLGGDDDTDDDSFEEYDDIIEETELSTSSRKNLPDESFGIPEDRKFPLHDKKHVISAIGYFAKAAKSKRKILADNINAQAKKFGMSINVSKDNPFYKYANKDILEK